MTKGRFGYIQPKVAASDEPHAISAPLPELPHTPLADGLRTVARGTGRMQQDREQLNVRLPTQLKRQASAQAALEGVTIGELIESLLLDYFTTHQGD